MRQILETLCFCCVSAGMSLVGFSLIMTMFFVSCLVLGYYGWLKWKAYKSPKPPIQTTAVKE